MECLSEVWSKRCYNGSMASTMQASHSSRRVATKANMPSLFLPQHTKTFFLESCKSSCVSPQGVQRCTDKRCQLWGMSGEVLKDTLEEISGKSFWEVCEGLASVCFPFPATRKIASKRVPDLVCNHGSDHESWWLPDCSTEIRGDLQAERSPWWPSNER